MLKENQNKETIQSYIDNFSKVLELYQDKVYANKYNNIVSKVFEKETKLFKDKIELPLTRKVALTLFRLMRYKDEYEVARLSLKAELDMALSQEFGASAKVHYMLHPPFLKGLANIPLLNRMPGVKSKLALSLLFVILSAILSAFLDALTVTAVLISVGVGFYVVYHKIHSSNLDLDDDGTLDRKQLSGETLEQFRSFHFLHTLVFVLPTSSGALLKSRSIQVPSFFS